jgi:AraC-like DNA-binding protein
MDPLSEVLRSVRLTGGVFLDVQLTAPWSIISELTAEDCRSILSEPAQLIYYHVVLAGGFFLTVDDAEALRVNAGEMVLLPRNDVHTLTSDLGLKPVHGRSLVQPPVGGGLARIIHGGPGTPTHMVCGFLGSEGAYNPLLATLPRVLKIDLRTATSRQWVESSVRFAADELVQGRLASSSVMSRLSEVLLVEAVRQHAESHTTEAGWLNGLADPYVGRALAIIHQDIAADWSIDQLAKAVALSRSAFIDRFSALVGMPPVRYQTVWRLQTARLHLSESKRSIAQIAPLVGYESEEAFSRAFKREFGKPPAAWREQNRSGPR